MRHLAVYSILLLLLAGCGVGGDMGEAYNNVKPDGNSSENALENPSVNSAPAADAGADRNVVIGSVVTLDGRACADADGDTLIYSWSIVFLPEGSAAVLSDPAITSPAFTVDMLGTYVISLIVNDGKSDSAADVVIITAVAPAIPVTSTIPDTGQEICLDDSGQILCPSSGSPHYGQDAQYSANPMSFTDNDDSTVTDNVTGLMWQKINDGKVYSWYEAAGIYDAAHNPGTEDVCGSLTLSGFSDWRLPSKRELMSIVNYGTYYPSINTAYFPDATSDYYWTSSEYPAGGSAWFVSFYLGFISPAAKDSDNYVRCVRGPYASTDDFTDNGNGTVTDNNTKLMWQQKDDSGNRSWQEALSYCEDLDLADHTDWRVPDIKELESLVDYSVSAPSINAGYFPDTKFSASSYWSSTSSLNPVYAWQIIFNGGNVSFDAKNSNSFSMKHYVRCVR